MNNIFFEITKNVDKNVIFNEKRKKCIYLCAISGGQDSNFLIFLLLHIKKYWNIDIYILHCNHLWQQNNFYSFKEIYKIAFIFKIPVYLNISEKVILNEMLARNWRQESFFRIFFFENCENILLGHTATDQLETSFFNLLRGTSLQGISNFKNTKYIKIKFFFKIFTTKLIANKLFSKNLIKVYCKNNFYKFYSLKKLNIRLIQYLFFFNNSYYISRRNKSLVFKTHISFILGNIRKNYLIIARPLLKLHRNDITILSKYYFIPVFTDFSNNFLDFSRNRIRLKIFTKLRYYFNLIFDRKFYQYLIILEEEEKYLNKIVLSLLKKKENLNKNYFFKLSKNLQRRYLYVILKNFLKKNPNFFFIELFINFLQKK